MRFVWRYNMAFAEEFSRFIRQRRLANGLSQDEVAARAGIHNTHLGLIERGERTPTISVADAICRALGARLVLANIDDENPNE